MINDASKRQNFIMANTIMNGMNDGIKHTMKT